MQNPTASTPWPSPAHGPCDCAACYQRALHAAGLPTGHVDPAPAYRGLAWRKAGAGNVAPVLAALLLLALPVLLAALLHAMGPLPLLPTLAVLALLTGAGVGVSAAQHPRCPVPPAVLALLLPLWAAAAYCVGAVQGVVTFYLPWSAL